MRFIKFSADRSSDRSFST